MVHTSADLKGRDRRITMSSRAPGPYGEILSLEKGRKGGREKGRREEEGRRRRKQGLKIFTKIMARNGKSVFI